MKQEKRNATLGGSFRGGRGVDEVKGAAIASAREGGGAVSRTKLKVFGDEDKAGEGLGLKDGERKFNDGARLHGAGKNSHTTY